MKTALVHDFLFEYAGSERVLEQMLHVFPQADLFAVMDFLPDGQRSFLNGHQAYTTFIQHFPLLRRNPPRFMPLAVPWMPLAIEQLNLSAYDLVISSSHSVAKGVLLSPEQVHISYIHSPMRYAWDLEDEYLRSGLIAHQPFRMMARIIFSQLRTWDVRTAHGVDAFIANSQFVASRIWRVYRRQAHVIYPPVDVSRFDFNPEKDNFYLVVSRLVPYKRVDLIVEAFNRMPGRQLVVIGDGPEMSRLRRLVGNNTRLFGYQPDEVVRKAMSKARALVVAAVEDFGITSVEAQASGTPVIALATGGSNETVIGFDQPEATGLFFEQQTVESLVEAVGNFEKTRLMIQPENCRKNAFRFRPERFREEFQDIVESEWSLRKCLSISQQQVQQEALHDG